MKTEKKKKKSDRRAGFGEVIIYELVVYRAHVIVGPTVIFVV